MNTNVFLLFFSFVFSLSSTWEKEKERERGYIKLGIRKNSPKVHLSYFDGFLWRICLLLRADRLYLIFSSGLKAWFLRVRDIFFVFFYPEFLALVPTTTNPVQQLIFLLSISADGKESPLPFWGPSQSFGFYLLPSRVRRLKWGYQVQTSVGLHCDPHSFLTVILWRLATVNSNTRRVVILFLSSQWDTTWQPFLQKMELELSFFFFIRSIYVTSTKNGGCPRGVMGKAMDCGIVVREFVLKSRYCVHFQANTIEKGMNPLILPAMG